MESGGRGGRYSQHVRVPLRISFLRPIHVCPAFFLPFFCRFIDLLLYVPAGRGASHQNEEEEEEDEGKGMTMMVMVMMVMVWPLHRARGCSPRPRGLLR